MIHTATFRLYQVMIHKSDYVRRSVEQLQTNGVIKSNFLQWTMMYYSQEPVVKIIYEMLNYMNFVKLCNNA